MSNGRALTILGLLISLNATSDVGVADRPTKTQATQRPNVVFIICDDLNDYIEGFGGHPQTKTPNMARLARSGVAFTQAHCNIPICGPSRASLFTGIYPHNSGCFGFTKWDGYAVLKNSRTMMDHFRENGYWTLGTGKLMHHMVRQEWKNYGNRADYGPWIFDGKNKLAHPDVPAPYREIGPVDGSFGPLTNLAGKTSADGTPLSWWTGNWANQRELKVHSEKDRDPTADELNGQWAVERLNEFADEPGSLPFFMGVGFIRPHTPLIVPQKYFDMFPLDSIELPIIRPADVEDTFSHTIRSIPEGADGPRSEDMGTRLFNTLVKSYPSQDEALRHFIQAYLASVASVDEQIGKILNAVDNSPLKDNTIIILTSDHGWGMGEKNYLYKNSLWQESTRVPLIIRAPGVAQHGGRSDQPVSLVDVYPTLVDLCGLKGDTKKNERGHSLDGHSLKPLLEEPQKGQWDGPASALTALYKWRMKYDPSQESFSLRAKDWRYIRYENGKEELYFTKEDPHEWTNLAADIKYTKTLAAFRQELTSRIPAAGTKPPPQPPFQSKQSKTKKAEAQLSADAWKDKYFSKHPNADANKDGKLTWPEYKAYRAKFDPVPVKPVAAKKKQDGLKETDSAKIDFKKDVAPILEERCWACHGEDEQESGLRLDLRAHMLKGGDSGLAALVPGKPEKSYLIEVVKHLDPDAKMPPDEDKLPTKEIELLERWVKQGAVWPGQMDAIVEKKSDHWSFQPVVRPAVPKVKTTSNNPIDAFLLQELARKNLAYSAPADPRSLIRRVSIVLTGLPPTPEENDAFLSAYATNPEKAYTNLVDRLLDSPHFGERWAQHWLDVIRWAETNGSESNMYRKNAWIYRDYVIRSFNEDKPYDRFLFEQIAGDSVGQGDATGYLVAGPHVPVATVGQEPAARRQARADRMDEILQTIGASAMGVTIGCARCHNHKFDAITIRDYYSMTAVFQDVEFGSRFPELAEDHPRRLRGKNLYSEILKLHEKLRPMGPWEEDWTGYKELHVSPVTTRKVRITFNWGGVRLDEIEIFGTADRHKNLALAKAGTQTFSPPAMSVGRADLKNVNDGEYGTQAWGARAPKGSTEKPWIEFTFTKPHEINRIRLSTNREDFFETDYLLNLNKYNFGGYRVEVQTAEGEWQQIANTMAFDQVNKKHPTRVGLLNQLQALIAKVNEEGPKPSFVARFINPVKTHVLGRGSPENPRDEVFPAGLALLNGTLDIKPYAPGRQRRKALAVWLTSPENPLTTRVAVNRIWHHVFGRGIVATTSDFGAAGASPTHPKLLDWLAAELHEPTTSPAAKPWSVKHMIRLMVTSKAFRQSSRPIKEGLAADADSTLLWRYPPKRNEAEVIRDSILQASGSLDRTIGGRSYRIHNVKKRYSQWEVTNNHGSDTWRRMIYQERMRRVDDQMFTAFDFPDCGQVRAKRPVSTTPLQALNLMNSDFVIEQSKHIAERARKESNGDERKANNRCFQLLLGRSPNRQERTASLSLAKNENLSFVCRALINSNEFAFLP